MADYYPLISRAIAGLDPAAPGENRRALYERARTALIAQLRTVSPPLTESEITRERLALEEAVRKVEAEAASRGRGGSRREGSPREGSGRGDPPAENPRGRGDASRVEPPRNDATRGDRLRARSRAATNETFAPQPPPFAQDAAERSRPLPPRGGDDAARPPRNMRDHPLRPRNSAPADPPATNEAPGVRGFRDVTADADDLGRAAARANRNARRTYANVPAPTPEFERLEPSLENRGADPAGYTFDEPSDPVADTPRFSQTAKKARSGAPKKPLKLGSGFPLKSAILVGLAMILIGAGILWGPRAYSTLRAMLRSSQSAVETPANNNAATTRPKIADRVGQPGESAPVAQRVVLYDEDPAEPNGKQYVGSVVWRIEPVKGGANANDVAVRADIEIPDRKFKMTMSFRRNTDTSLPASHTVELTFVLAPDATGGGVTAVPGILMKSNELARGAPLAGQSVKVTDGFFLLALSGVDSERARNMQLLKERSWFDIPVVYANQRRAIVAIEKGSPGERAFTDAFANWGE